MRGTEFILLAALACAPVLAAQQPVAPLTPPPPPPDAIKTAAPPTGAAKTTTLPAELQPALDAIYQASGSLKFDRWKRGSVRDEATSNVNEILADVKTNLPPLQAAASSAPFSLSKVLPLARNIDALYDVVLRVGEAARVAAPDDQANQLRNALVSLDKARLALADQMQLTAAAQEKQVVDLQTSLHAAKATACPAPPPVVTPKCPAPPVVKRKKKPVTPPATTPAPAGTTPPATPPASTTH
jgi:hypothetical protein